MGGLLFSGEKEGGVDGGGEVGERDWNERRRGTDTVIGLGKN